MDVRGVPGTSSGAGGEDHRAEFNSAYAHLEQTIRNFSKEKTSYEQTIEGLRNQLKMANENVRSLVIRNETVLGENKMLHNVQEEHESQRYQLENFLYSLETKQEIILTALDSLHQFAPQLDQQNNQNADFVAQCKYRQVQLKEWIDETMKKNEEISLQYRMSQEECEHMRQALDHATKKIEDQVQEIERSKEQFNQDFDKQDADHRALVEELENQRKVLVAQIGVLEENIRCQREAFEKDKEAIEMLLETERKKLEDLNAVLANDRLAWETKQKEMEANAEKMRHDLDNQRKELTAKLDTMTLEKEQECKKLTETIKNFEEKNECLQNSLEETVAKSSMEIGLLKGANEQLKNQLATGEEDIARFKGKISEVEKQVLELSDLNTEMKMQFATEKSSLEEEVRTAKAENIELKTRYDEEVDCLKKNLDKTQKTAVEAAQQFDSENAKWTAQVKEVRKALQETEDNHQEVTKTFELKVSTLVKANDELGSKIEILEAKIKEQEASLEESKQSSLASGEAFEKRMQETLEAHVAEKAGLQNRIDELNKSVNQVTASIKELELAKDNLAEELTQKINELTDVGTALEKDKTMLLEELQELKQTSETEANNLQKELKTLESTIEENQSKIRKMSRELEATRAEKNHLLKKYESQKSAIAKMVEQVDVRPVLLPKGKGRLDTSINGTPQNSQDASSSEMGMKTPKTPFTRPPSRADPMTPTRAGILKRRNTYGGFDKNRSVSFGTVDVQNFQVSSETETEHENDSQSTKEGNRKKMKLAEKRKGDSDGEKNEQPAKPRQEKERRFLKKGIQTNKKMSAPVNINSDKDTDDD